MTSPVTFVDSWNAAEAALFNALATATGCKAGAGCFHGALPPRMGVWSLSPGRFGDENVLWSPDVSVIRDLPMVVGSFPRLEECQAWGMKIVKALPWANIQDGGNVSVARIRAGGSSEPKFVELETGSTSASAMCWRLTLGMEIVFNTGGRAA